MSSLIDLCNLIVYNTTMIHVLPSQYQYEQFLGLLILSLPLSKFVLSFVIIFNAVLVFWNVNDSQITLVHTVSMASSNS